MRILALCQWHPQGADDEEALLGALFALGALTLAAHARADEQTRPRQARRLPVQVDADFGGDDVATVFFEDDSDQDLKAGQGLAISVGGYFRPMARFAVRARRPAWATSTSPRRPATPTFTCHARCCSSKACTAGPTAFSWAPDSWNTCRPRSTATASSRTSTSTMRSGVNLEIGWRWISVHYVNMSYSSDGAVRRQRGREPRGHPLHLALRPALANR